VRFDLAAGGVPVSLSELPPALGPEFISRAEPFRFQGPWTHPIYGYFYAPSNAEGSEGPPPLIVRVHGGPTGRNSAIYDPEVHFFTTRGFAVLAVDYRGSSGYGREFREAIFGRWGKADVEDCIAAAKHFAEAGRVDGARMFIRGRSAGGMTTLMALVGETVFRGGVDMFGVVDPKSLALVAPRFESTYDEALIGDLDDETYLARTPMGSAKNIRAPVLILQGNEDAIVPPTQSELIVEKLRAAGVPHAYEVFEGEGHGFRKAASIVRALELELAFYQDLLV
jgi:dipeptidyl aminopeptidase/acylaminoacyl peptidase